MVNEIEVLDVLQQLTEIEPSEIQAATDLCKIYLETTRLRLKDGSSNSDPRVIAAAAAEALYALCVRRYVDSSQVSSFKAGDLSITQNSTDNNKKLTLAQQLRDKAETELIPLLKDNGFFAGKIDI